MKLSILIPVHNEALTLKQILDAVWAVDVGPWEKEVIAVNDGSSDSTLEIFGNFAATHPSGFYYASHEKKLGKGAAINSALELSSGEYAVIQDADMEYNPKELVKLTSIISHGKELKAVFGSRGIKQYPQRGWHYVLGAKLLT